MLELEATTLRWTGGGRHPGVAREIDVNDIARIALLAPSPKSRGREVMELHVRRAGAAPPHDGGAVAAPGGRYAVYRLCHASHDKQLYKWVACIALRAGAKEVFRRRSSNFGAGLAHPSLLSAGQRVRSMLKASRRLRDMGAVARERRLSPSQAFFRGRSRGMTIPSGEVTDEVDDEGLPVAVSRAYTAGAMFLRSSAGEKYLVKDVLLRLVLGGDGSGGGAARYGGWWARDPTGRVRLKEGEHGDGVGDGASTASGGEYAAASVRIDLGLKILPPPPTGAAEGGGGGADAAAAARPRRAWRVGCMRWSFAGEGAAAAVRGDEDAAWGCSVPLGDITEVAILEGLDESDGQPILCVRFRRASCPWVRFSAEAGDGDEDGDFIYRWAAVLLLALGFAQELDF